VPRVLHPDSDKRKAEINKLSELFRQKGYKATSAEIEGFNSILDGNAVPADFLKRLDHLLGTFEKEFAAAFLPISAYRQGVCSEIRQVIIDAIGRMGVARFAQEYMQVYPVTERLKDGRKIVGDIADELAQNTNLSEKGRFYLYCLAYAIIVEGVFDEVARILYFLKIETPTRIPTTQEILSKTVWNVYREITPTPLFLQNWEEKKKIRNSIGHATFSFDVSRKEIRFIDEIAGYDEVKTLSAFVTLLGELESVVEAYTYNTLLLKVYDFVVATNAFV
jgi:hypothetical protein